MCTLYMSLYGYVQERIHIYIHCQHCHIWGAHCGAGKKWGFLLLFHRDMVMLMFLLLLSEDSRVVGEKVWCSCGYLCKWGNIRKAGTFYFECCVINSAFPPSWESSKSYKKNGKQKSILCLSFKKEESSDLQNR